MDYKKLSKAEKDLFDRDGYVLIKGMLTPKEVQKLYDIAIHDEVISHKSFDRNGIRITGIGTAMDFCIHRC